MECCIPRCDGDALDMLVRELDDAPEVRVREIEASGSDIVQAIRSNGFDMILFPFTVCDLVRTVRKSANPDPVPHPKFVIAANPVSLAVKALAMLSGFHGVIDADAPRDSVNEIKRIHSGELTLLTDPQLAELNLTAGLLSRTLLWSDDVDQSVLNLLGVGLSDGEIAATIGIGIQTVHNRIAALLELNGLPYRTQLAVARAATLMVPDFS